MTRIGDLLVEFKELPKGQDLEVLTLTEKNGFVRQADRFHKRLATEDVSRYKVIRPNDIAFNPYLVWAGAVAQNTLGLSGIISPLYPTFSVRDGLDPRFVGRLLLAPQVVALYDGIAFGSVPRRRRTSVSDFLALTVPTPPPIEEQRRIAAILDRCDELLARSRRGLSQIEALASATFLRLFNDSESRCAPLSDLADVSSGITKGRRLPPGTPTTVLPYLAVSNVKDRALDLEVVKTIAVSAEERLRYLVRSGDLLMTEGGDPDKLGRGTLWNEELPEILHQNHIFRVRLRAGVPMTSTYLSWYTASRQAKAYFLKAAKQTTGIASINKTQLSALPVPIPKSEVQADFERQLRGINLTRSNWDQRHSALIELRRGVVSNAFSGQL